MFFTLGLILSLYGKESGWRWYIVLAVGCGFGLLDEGMKIWLPTREFDVFDLMKDWIGVAVAMLVVRLLGLKKIE